MIIFANNIVSDEIITLIIGSVIASLTSSSLFLLFIAPQVGLNPTTIPTK